MERGINVVALVKDGERYIFLYDNESTPALLQTLGKFASNPELSFTWHDAAILSQKVRKLNDEPRTADDEPFRAPRAAR
ncbi:MAG: hypothetical protein JSS02_01730 [Planctomycetes bacterium]|nr:hypothetical protein [Planctomycetota bacterium]